jgi:hypothetical protein
MNSWDDIRELQFLTIAALFGLLVLLKVGILISQRVSCGRCVQWSV